jgi:hypothetical protein
MAAPNPGVAPKVKEPTAHALVVDVAATALRLVPVRGLELDRWVRAGAGLYV